MTIKMMVEYKGHTVSFESYERTFAVSLDGVTLKKGFRDLEKCEEYIDRRTKEVYNRIPVICKPRWEGSLKEAEATSVVDEDEVWIVMGKDREKKPFSQVYLNNESNKVKIEAMSRLKADNERISNAIKDIMDSLDRLTPEMMRVTK